LERGGNIYEIDGEGWNTLHYACRGGHEKVIERLKMLGMQLNCQAGDGSVPLHIASRYSHPELVNFLLTHGADTHAVDKNGWNALHHSAKDGTVAVADALLKQGVEMIIKRTHDGDTAMGIAEKEGNKDVQQFLNSFVSNHLGISSDEDRKHEKYCIIL